MLRYLPAATAILWTVNLLYLLAIQAWPMMSMPAVHRTLLTAAAMGTLALIITRTGSEFHIGYMAGRVDSAREDHRQTA